MVLHLPVALVVMFPYVVSCQHPPWPSPFLPQGFLGLACAPTDWPSRREVRLLLRMFRPAPLIPSVVGFTLLAPFAISCFSVSLLVCSPVSLLILLRGVRCRCLAVSGISRTRRFDCSSQVVIHEIAICSLFGLP